MRCTAHAACRPRSGPAAAIMRWPSRATAARCTGPCGNFWTAPTQPQTPEPAKPPMVGGRSAEPWCCRPRRTGPTASASKGSLRRARVDSVRRSSVREQRQSRYFALSRELPPREVLRVVRAHWTIENGQHWLLDVVMDEDRARARKDNAAE